MSRITMVKPFILILFMALIHLKCSLTTLEAVLKAGHQPNLFSTGATKAIIPDGMAGSSLSVNNVAFSRKNPKNPQLMASNNGRDAFLVKSAGNKRTMGPTEAFEALQYKNQDKAELEKILDNLKNAFYVRKFRSEGEQFLRIFVNDKLVNETDEKLLEEEVLNTFEMLPSKDRHPAFDGAVDYALLIDVYKQLQRKWSYFTAIRKEKLTPDAKVYMDLLRQEAMYILQVDNDTLKLKIKAARLADVNGAKKYIGMLESTGKFEATKIQEMIEKVTKAAKFLADLTALINATDMFRVQSESTVDMMNKMAQDLGPSSEYRDQDKRQDQDEA